MRPESGLPSFAVLGRRLYAGNAGGAMGWLLNGAAGPRVVCVANVHTLVGGLWDRELGRAQDNADLSLADGRPLSLLGKFEGAWEARQLRGPDLMRGAAGAGLAQGTRHFFYGGAAGVAKAVAKRLQSEFKGMKAVGAESPPFGELDDVALMALVARLKRSGADLLWVGLGAPKQEKTMARLAALGAPVTMIGVGAAFDYYAGTKTEAPRWMQQASLEWLFRLASEPGRLWKRYLATNPMFICLAWTEHFGFYPGSAQGFSERLMRLACLPPMLAALGQGRPEAALLAALMPAWLGRLFWLARR